MRKAFNLSVLVASLGYFVDMYDITIFGVVRIASLTDLGITDPSQLTDASVLLMNLQAFGMLIGGILWGVLGDKRGRLSILFGSILLYSAANILNAFVTDLNQYAFLRFVAGVGLAGELGAAVTLVTETMSKETRGYGTTIIATLGLLGAVTASLTGQLLPWRMAYLIGGAMGALLLVARFKMADSKLYEKSRNDTHRGDLRLFFSGDRFKRYICCIVVGVPVYFTSGVLFTFAPELASGLGLQGVTAGNALLYGCIGLTVGDLLSGVMSQLLKSRKLAVYISLAVGLGFTFVYLLAGIKSVVGFYAVCFILGPAAGYWAVLVTIAAEQFGTNIRATVATSIPNFVRSSVIVLSLAFTLLKGSLGLVNSALVIGVVVFAAAAFSLHLLRETFGEDLDFVEGVEGEQVTASGEIGETELPLRVGSGL